MTITFTENGGVSLSTPTIDFSGATGGSAWWMQTAAAVGGAGTSSGQTFNVPIGPPVPTIGYKPFDSPVNAAGDMFIPGISASQTTMVPPTKTNEEIKLELLKLQALDINAYKDFEDAMAESGYDDVDAMLYGAALAQQPWEEHLAQRVASGVYAKGGGGPTTTVTTNVSNRGAAMQTINPAFERGLGRSVGYDEITDFKKTLNKFERANPYVTNSGKGYSTTTGGFNPAELARSYVEGQDDYAESQVASTFLGVLDRILDDPNNNAGPDLQERMSRAGY